MTEQNESIEPVATDTPTTLGEVSEAVELNAETEHRETDNTDSNDSTETEHDETDKPKKSSFEKRISKLNQRVEEQRREAEYWRNEALKTKPASAPEAVKETTSKPKYADFSDIETYTEAVTDWKLEQREIQSRETRERESQTQQLDSYNKRVSEYAKSNPSFHEDLADTSDIPTAPEIATICIESDVGPAIVHYLAQNTDEIERINKLSPHRRLIELGKIEDRLMATNKKPLAKVIKPAPTPVKPVSGPAAVTTKSIYEMTPSELIKHRNSQSRR